MNHDQSLVTNACVVLEQRHALQTSIGFAPGVGRPGIGTGPRE